MSTTNLTRWSGLAAMIGGIAVALFVFALFPFGGFAEGGDPANLQTGLHSLAHALHIFGGVLALLGLVGLYARQSEKTGWLGLIGFVLAFIGTTLFVGLGVIAEFVLPAIGANAPALLESTGALGDSNPMFPATFLPFLAGYVLLGIATMRARVLPRWSGLLLILGAILFALPVPWPVPVVGIVLYAAGMGWIGYALWTEKGRMAGQAKPAI